MAHPAGGPLPVAPQGAGEGAPPASTVAATLAPASAASVKVLPRPLPGSLAAPELWADYTRRFVSPEGRVIDTANGGISHSEGQGYGMLLAVAADDRPVFDRIWSWTQANLDVRDDGLAAWRWEPGASPAVTDRNNASDGDLLIAWALAEAGRHWADATLTDAARARARALRDLVTEDRNGRPMLLPGASGFTADDRPDGPVVNPSYWVFPAFPVLAALDGGPRRAVDWTALSMSGLALLAESRFGAQHLPAEWVALGAEAPRPAEGFPPLFGYNAIRVPLYLAWAGPSERQQLAPFAAAWSSRVPEVVDLTTGTPGDRLTDRGYRAIADLVRCVMEGTPMPADLRVPSDEPYYPATLRALALVAVKQRYPECW
ncbi:cellulase [Microvirga tunisiensis]|uniref:cellulase n=2 Tax=Pannonibacter tanglangensis TaxID=2750084 RepID=A0ABW9ZJ77_9HYPH|nr:cellulase [Pannonibacter sp. XCT-34]